jgi:hypothetical protein
MSRNQRKLLFVAATSTLLVALQSLAIADKCKYASNRACNSADRQKILADEQPKAQKSVVKPKGGSTGPTAPPTHGGSHK